MTQYQLKANAIITEAIKSAIFIDEKALDFYAQKSEEVIIEEQLSIDLFTNFKENGVSLAIHKFSASNVDDEALKNYLFQDRDLVLLDWELGGDKFSLQLLADIVNRPHIHFCAIYTSTSNIGSIFNNIISFFSNKTEEDFTHIKDELSAYEDRLQTILGNVDVDNTNSNGDLISEIIRIDRNLVTLIKSATNNSDPKIGLKLLKIAFDFNNEFINSDTPNQSPEIIDRHNQVIVINNTIITILQKNQEQDRDTRELIKRLSLQIANSNNSFTQLLGLEMQNIFSKKGAFIDSNLLRVSKETIAYHRNKLNETDTSDFAFTEMMKNVLIEHANLNLGEENLSLLDSVIFEEIANEGIPSNEELMAMNVFYNSVKIKNTKKLNFGDVFKNSIGEYFICITALCDCYLPEKINNRFYFAKGTSIDKDLALMLGDTAFISYLTNDLVVSWVAQELDNFKYDASNVDMLNSAIIHYKQFKYKPVYIKPYDFHVTSNQITDNQIEITRIETRSEADFEFTKLDYITTIKPNYTQRIANHAFTHPVRVGVDFVKKK